MRKILFYFLSVDARNMELFAFFQKLREYEVKVGRNLPFQPSVFVTAMLSLTTSLCMVTVQNETARFSKPLVETQIKKKCMTLVSDL
jgi:hypothetical protein